MTYGKLQRSRGTRSGFQALAQIEAKSTSPYGLPIVDNCSECKLRGTDFFCCLSAPALAALDEIKHTTSYPEGALVFMEGQAARGVYILCQGAAKLSTTSTDGKTFILKIARTGEALGVHAVIADTLHEVTVETLRPSPTRVHPPTRIPQIFKGARRRMFAGRSTSEPRLSICLRCNSFHRTVALGI